MKENLCIVLVKDFNDCESIMTYIFSLPSCVHTLRRKLMITIFTHFLSRSMLIEKFLLWKVFPVRCLRWILHFAVLEFPPDATLPRAHTSHGLLETTQRLAAVWSKREFVQSAPVEQQVCILKSSESESCN